MSNKQYVQHMSGEGGKWEVVHDWKNDGRSWRVHDHLELVGFLYLPSSEYRLCDPPEVWKDVTDDIVVTGRSIVFGTDTYDVVPSGYRLIRTPGGLRVEKKDPA